MLIPPAVGAGQLGVAAPPSVSSGGSFSETELNLLTANFVSHDLLYSGFFNTNDRHFPRLLTGSSTGQFWPLSQSVMVLAPHRSASVEGHDAGALLFSGVAGTRVHLTTIDANSGAISGDGLEAYFFVTPLRTVNWEVPYYVTNPEGVNGTFAPCQGDVLFPFSLTPYIVVQWEPAYSLAPCGSGYGGHDFNLYLVRPAPDGTVGRGEITGLWPDGSHQGPLPRADDLLRFDVSYYGVSGVLRAVVEDLTHPAARSQLDVNLTRLGFRAGDQVGSNYYFGLGGSGNYPAGWGALFVAFRSWVPLGSLGLEPLPQGDSALAKVIARYR